MRRGGGGRKRNRRDVETLGFHSVRSEVAEFARGKKKASSAVDDSSMDLSFLGISNQQNHSGAKEPPTRKRRKEEERKVVEKKPVEKKPVAVEQRKPNVKEIDELFEGFFEPERNDEQEHEEEEEEDRQQQVEEEDVTESEKEKGKKAPAVQDSPQLRKRIGDELKRGIDVDDQAARIVRLFPLQSHASVVFRVILDFLRRDLTSVVSLNSAFLLISKLLSTGGRKFSFALPLHFAFLDLVKNIFLKDGKECTLSMIAVRNLAILLGRCLLSKFVPSSLISKLDFFPLTKSKPCKDVVFWQIVLTLIAGSDEGNSLFRKFRGCSSLPPFLRALSDPLVLPNLHMIISGVGKTLVPSIEKLSSKLLVCRSLLETTVDEEDENETAVQEE